MLWKCCPPVVIGALRVNVFKMKGFYFFCFILFCIITPKLAVNLPHQIWSMSELLQENHPLWKTTREYIPVVPSFQQTVLLHCRILDNRKRLTWMVITYKSELCLRDSTIWKLLYCNIGDCNHSCIYVEHSLKTV